MPRETLFLGLVHVEERKEEWVGLHCRSGVGHPLRSPRGLKSRSPLEVSESHVSNSGVIALSPFRHPLKSAHDLWSRPITLHIDLKKPTFILMSIKLWLLMNTTPLQNYHRSLNLSSCFIPEHRMKGSHQEFVKRPAFTHLFFKPASIFGCSFLNIAA